MTEQEMKNTTSFLSANPLGFYIAPDTEALKETHDWLYGACQTVLKVVDKEE